MKRVKEMAEKQGWKMSHVALAWINKRVASPIIGFSSVGEDGRGDRVEREGADGGGGEVSGGAVPGEGSGGSSIAVDSRSSSCIS